jgi:hypothetical protein
MPRRVRIQFPDARYHVINRGNFRQPVFATAGAAAAFELTLGQTIERYRWRTQAYSAGWAIGTAGWRKALAKEYALTSLCPGLRDSV